MVAQVGLVVVELVGLEELPAGLTLDQTFELLWQVLALSGSLKTLVLRLPSALGLLDFSGILPLCRGQSRLKCFPMTLVVYLYFHQR